MPDGAVNPRIFGYGNMVVRLENFDAGIAAYSKMFPAGPFRSGENVDMGLKFALFSLPNGGAIEIVAPTRPDCALHPMLKSKGPGFQSISFQCEDLAETIAMMKSNGVRVMDDDPTHIYVHPKSTHGVLMQLVEKPPNAPKGNNIGWPDNSGVTGIVSFKCLVVLVKDIEEAITSYQKLGLSKLNFKIVNKAAGIAQAGMFLPGGGLIELLSPLDLTDEKNGLVQLLKKQGDGMWRVSFNGSSGAVDALNAAGVVTVRNDDEHFEISRHSTLTRNWFMQVNPVGMATKYQVKLTAPTAKL